MATEQIYRVTGDVPCGIEMSLREFQDKYLTPVEHQSYPKALYLHPSYPAHEHKAITVKNEDELKSAQDAGYQTEPHSPVVEEDQDFETVPVVEPAPETVYANNRIVPNGDQFNAFDENDVLIGTYPTEAEAKTAAGVN